MVLQERILKTLEKRDDVDQRTLAGVVGINESSISRYMNGHDELNFEFALKIVKFLYEEQEQEVMAEYIFTQRNQNTRYALEYCCIQRMTEFEQLIDRLLASSNALDREWARMYRLLHLQQTNQSKQEELLQKLESFVPKSLEMRILKKLVLGYIYHDLSENDLLNDQLRRLESQIRQVRSSFIRECFNIRLGLSMNHVYLFRNEVEKSRHYSNIVLNQEVANHVKATAYHHLGHSYMFEDYDTAKNYMEEAIRMFQQTNRTHLAKYTEYNLSFLQSWWKIEREFPFKLEGYQEISENIFYLIQKDDMLKAKEMINQIDFESLPNGRKAFYLYYLGRINKDEVTLYQSVRMFRRIGDLFHLFLPLQALQQLGEKEYVLEILAE